MFYNREKSMAASEEFKEVHNQTTLQKNPSAIPYITEDAVGPAHNMIILETGAQLCSAPPQATAPLHSNLHYSSSPPFDSTSLIWMSGSGAPANVAYTPSCLRLSASTVPSTLSPFSSSIVWYFLL